MMTTNILTAGKYKVKIGKLYDIMLPNNSNAPIQIKPFQRVAIAQYGVATLEMQHAMKPPDHITVNKIQNSSVWTEKN